MAGKGEEFLTVIEANLIQGCATGDRYSQSGLYNHFAPKMLVVCLRYSKSREEAEEILQEGFMKVFRFIHQFKSEGSFEGWIRKIMVNCALQKIRSQLRLSPVINMAEYNKEVSDQVDVESNITAKELLKLVMTLPPAYKMVFNLYVFEGYKHREIGELLGISEGT